MCFGFNEKRSAVTLAFFDSLDSRAMLVGNRDIAGTQIGFSSIVVCKHFFLSIATNNDNPLSINTFRWLLVTRDRMIIALL
jgi:hypothetical protein